MLTETQLRQILPLLPLAKLQEYLPHLNAAMRVYEVGSVARTAAFVAQTAHESAQYTRMLESLFYTKPSGLMATWPRRFPDEASALPYVRNEEKLANFVYANRMGNGDTASGDGFRYRGRGVIQLTGREKYRLTGEALGVDLLANPDLAQTPDIAFKAAGLFWKSAGLNELADTGDFRTITQRINGGQNGAADRLKYFEKAKAVLAAGFVADAPITRGARSAIGVRLLPGDPGPWGGDRAPDASEPTDAGPVAKEAGAKEATAKKATAGNATAKKAGGKQTEPAKAIGIQTAAGKAASKKGSSTAAGVQQPGVRKTAAKKTAPKRTATKKVATKKVATKKVATKKVATKKVAGRPSAAKPVSTKTVAGKAAGARKPPGDQIAVRKTTANKTAVKNGAAKNIAVKKAAAKKAAARQTAAKSAAKKAARR